MKANELRIGNYVLVNGHLQKVCEIPLPENCTDKNTKPIELTEEILLKCGFENNLGVYFLEEIKGYFKFPFKESKDILFKSHGGDDVCRLKHLHQLQNLYYALTGQELEINL